MMYRSPERSPQASRGGFFLYSAQASFSWPRVDPARLLRRAYSRSIWIISFEFVKVSVGFVSLSGKASLISISAAILFLRSWHVYFPLEFEFRGKSCVKWEHVGENGISSFLPCTLLLYVEWIWTNYCKLSRNVVGAIRTAIIKCRVSFIDLYSVFPRNFRMVFLPHSLFSNCP